MESIKIAILEDHSVVTEGIISVLKTNPFFPIVGEFRTGEELLRFLEKRQIDFLLLDIDLPDCNGLDILKEVKEKYPKTKVVIFSLHGSRVYVEDAIRLKADGYMIKSDPISHLPSVIQAVVRGEKYISEGVSKETLPFSPFQIEIINLLIQGLSQNEVAEKIQKSRKTVEYHLNQMRTKFACKNNNELISKYQKEIQK
ncbi:response regulator transcription factor [Leptospira ilyithenensis]|uniref:DNA-binding response regulator n=1 Tax=Leptospira ilyithenensis TaxID=2484901 RepID=A0A4R9LSE2_9LEPT|nr:response regulator transcription factor [Leptospira ilyithenensis]TGN09816.1 DNA-binding response regulator [Leptospira ilyithenensis]